MLKPAYTAAQWGALSSASAVEAYPVGSTCRNDMGEELTVISVDEYRDSGSSWTTSRVVERGPSVFTLGESGTTLYVAIRDSKGVTNGFAGWRLTKAEPRPDPAVVHLRQLLAAEYERGRADAAVEFRLAVKTFAEGL